MCGILFSESSLSPETMELISRRGRNWQKLIELPDASLFSSVLSIRSTIQQPIVEELFTLQYNGEIYNNSESDTLFIRDLVLKHINLKCTENIQSCFEFLSKVYENINMCENELALCIKVGNFVCFFKDDVGRKSLGFSLNPFTISSLLYSTELDSMKLYIYDLVTKSINSIFKPRIGLISKYFNQIYRLKSFINSEKYQKEHPYLLEYHGLLESTVQCPSESSSRSDNIEILHTLLISSFKKRKYNESPVVFLSGGIDSLIVAIYIHLTIESDKTIYLINTSVPELFDRTMGILAYKDLVKMFPERKFIFIQNDLNLDLIIEHRSRIETLIKPKNDKMTFNIACVMYFSAMIASKYSKIVYLGSGADELFGGYSKYKADNFRNQMFLDLFTISSHNLCRDDRVISDWNVEARFPLLDTEIILFSLNLPDSDLIDEKFNKAILRKILKYNKFNRASEVPKKAMQFGTGMNTFESFLYE